MDRRIESYVGYAYHLPLRQALSERDETRVWRFIAAEYHRNPSFGTYHLIGAGIRGAFPTWFRNTDDWTAFFCSEFIVAALKVARVAPCSINSALFQPGSIEELGL